MRKVSYLPAVLIVLVVAAFAVSGAAAYLPGETNAASADDSNDLLKLEGINLIKGSWKTINNATGRISGQPYSIYGEIEFDDNFNGELFALVTAKAKGWDNHPIKYTMSYDYLGNNKFMGTVKDKEAKFECDGKKLTITLDPSTLSSSLSNAKGDITLIFYRSQSPATTPTASPIYPTVKPTSPIYPTVKPTYPVYPTVTPIYPTVKPTSPIYPTVTPVYPTVKPTSPIYPTVKPTSPIYPTVKPTSPIYPTVKPTSPIYPTVKPTSPIYPTVKPTSPIYPTVKPTSPIYPTVKPTSPIYPTVKPTSPIYPTVKPTSPIYPTVKPTSPIYPTVKPTSPIYPTVKPTSPIYPTVKPTYPVYPTATPVYPTVKPTSPIYPTVKPTSPIYPTVKPTSPIYPTVKPTSPIYPTATPTPSQDPEELLKLEGVNLIKGSWKTINNATGRISGQPYSIYGEIEFDDNFNGELFALITAKAKGWDNHPIKYTMSYDYLGNNKFMGTVKDKEAKFECDGKKLTITLDPSTLSSSLSNAKGDIKLIFYKI